MSFIENYLQLIVDERHIDMEEHFKQLIVNNFELNVD